MTKREINLEREKVLAHVLLRRFRSKLGDVTLPELSELFEMESLPVAAKFFTYSAFAKWVARIPDLTVEAEATGQRKASILRLDAPAAMFVGARTGEALTIDFQAIRDRYRCMPIGDLSCPMDAEVAP
jgi:hypothetical protein